jgi:tartrate/fumarate subfamily iron-sulfur-dependent hydro-lyase beta chain
MLVFEKEKIMIKLKTPLKTENVTKLKVGDKVLISGEIFTARDKAHLFLLENNFEKIRNSVIYHCGPLVRRKGRDYKILSAGPTTSERLSMYTPELIEKYGIKAIIGKGGTDSKVLKALKGRSVYLSAAGGAGVLYAKSIVRVKGVYKLEFGIPDAIWVFEVKDFPTIVTMDSKGRSLHERILEKSRERFIKLISKS